MKYMITICMLVIFASCSHPTKDKVENKLEPVESQRDTASIFSNKERLADKETEPNQEVYLNGSYEAELELFKQMSRQIQTIIKRQTSDLRGQPDNQRAFHSKSHACLRANMILDKDRPTFTRYGIFSDDYNDKSWKVWARFSNGVGWKQADNVPDVRGLALKVLKVPGKKFMTDEKETQDFIMINSPVGFGEDAIDFMNFAEGNSKYSGLVGLAHTAAAAVHSSSVSAVGKGLTSTVLQQVNSVAKIQYWSGTPYLLGQKGAMKYTVVPENDCKYKGTNNEKPDGGSNLRDELFYRAKFGFCMSLYVQFQDADFKKTPIEDSSVEWQTQMHKVATLEFTPENLNRIEDIARCDNLSFNPWHAIEEHRPLGSQNRARQHVYKSSHDYRNTKTPIRFPAGWEVQ